MQPFLEFLLAEVGVFYLAILGDVYLTNALVRWHGPEVEVNPRVRQMYENNNFWGSRAMLVFMLIVYLGLAGMGLDLVRPYIPFAVVLFGLPLPLISMINLVNGSMVFYQLKKLRSN